MDFAVIWKVLAVFGLCSIVFTLVAVVVLSLQLVKEKLEVIVEHKRNISKEVSCIRKEQTASIKAATKTNSEECMFAPICSQYRPLSED